jgi:hypothetical protein
MLWQSSGNILWRSTTALSSAPRSARRLRLFDGQRVQRDWRDALSSGIWGKSLSEGSADVVAVGAGDRMDVIRSGMAGLDLGELGTLDAILQVWDVLLMVLWTGVFRHNNDGACVCLSLCGGCT